jgi:opacity protein-like surface antigen
MASQVAGAVSTTLKLTFAATGSLAATLTAGVSTASAAPVDQTAKVDPGRWADAFNGWSLGFGANYNFFRDSSSINSYDWYTSSEVASSPGLQANSPFADVDVGKDFRAGNYVFGVYGNFFAGEKLATYQSSAVYSNDDLKLQYGASLVGRAGVVAGSQTLFYGLFGWTWQHYQADLSEFYPVGPGNFNASESGFLNGPTVGAGIEWLLPNHPDVSFKTEYRYTHFDSPGTISNGPTTVTFGNVDDHMIRFIMTFKLP